MGAERKSKAKAICIGIGFFIFVLFLLSLFIIGPPIEGYYRSEIVTILDFSKGYIQLKDGEIYIVNVGGSEGDSRIYAGVYRILNRNKIVITFDPSLNTKIAYVNGTVRWLCFEWGEEMGLTNPKEYRVWSPFLKSRLRKVKIQDKNE